MVVKLKESTVGNNLPAQQEDAEVAAQISSTGIGGPLLCLLSGLSGWHPKVSWWVLCPLWFIVAVPLTLLCPPFLPLLIMVALQRSWRQDAKLPLARSGFSPLQLSFMSLHLGAVLKQKCRLLLILVAVYYLIAIGGSYLLGSAIDAATAVYVAQAQAHQALQIATPEQIRYSNSVVNYISLYLLVLMLTIIVLFASTIVVLLSTKDEQGHKVLALEKTGTAVSALFFKNLPGFAMILALMYAVFMTVERYYAHLRVVAIEAMVLGREYFDPSVWFLLLRGYLSEAFFISLVLIVLMSCGLIARSHQRAPQGPSPKMGPL